MDQQREDMYREKIRRLEEDIAGLRASRRIIMTMLEQGQITGNAERQRLARENRRLSRKLADYAGRLWRKETMN